MMQCGAKKDEHVFNNAKEKLIESSKILVNEYKTRLLHDITDIFAGTGCK